MLTNPDRVFEASHFAPDPATSLLDSSLVTHTPVFCLQLTDKQNLSISQTFQTPVHPFSQIHQPHGALLPQPGMKNPTFTLLCLHSSWVGKAAGAGGSCLACGHSGVAHARQEAPSFWQAPGNSADTKIGDKEATLKNKITDCFYSCLPDHVRKRRRARLPGLSPFRGRPSTN